MQKEFSLELKNHIGSIVCGVCWLLAGIFINYESKEALIATSFFLVGAAVSMLVLMFIQSVEGDEMSEMNYLKSRVRTYNSCLLTFIIFALMGVINRLTVEKDFFNNWQAWTMMFIGIQQVISGIYFAKYEKDGD